MALSYADNKLFSKLNIDAEEARNTNEERLVISLMVDCNFNDGNKFVALKFRMYKGHHELIYLDVEKSLQMLEILSRPFVENRFVDRRVKVEDKEPNEPVVSNFLIYQPDIEQEELDAVQEGMTIKIIRSFEFDDAFIFLIALDNYTVHRYVIPDQIAIYLLEYFQQLQGLLNRHKGE
jgi:hypothetical protein